MLCRIVAVAARQYGNADVFVGRTAACRFGACRCHMLSANAAEHRVHVPDRYLVQWRAT